MSFTALLAGRATFTRHVFLLGSQLPLSTSTISPISTLSVRTRSGICQTAVHPTPISVLNSISPQITTTRFANFETSFPQLTTVSYFETAKPLSKTSLISLNASSLASFSPKPFLSLVEISVLKQVSPLIKDSISSTLPIVAVSSPQVASQIPINTSLGPSVTCTVSITVCSLITSLEPKAMADVTVASESLYKVPSSVSTFLINPIISDMSIASKASAEEKYILHTDPFSASSMSEKANEIHYVYSLPS